MVFREWNELIGEGHRRGAGPAAVINRISFSMLTNAAICCFIHVSPISIRHSEKYVDEKEKARMKKALRNVGNK